VEQLVARRAHNPKVAGSNPVPATKMTKRLYYYSVTVFFWRKTISKYNYMYFKDLQKDMRVAYLGGGTGILISGVIWLISGLSGMYFTKEVSILVLFFGGMLIYPFGVLSAKLLNRTGKPHKDNPLVTLATESTIILFVGLFISYSIFQIQNLWFYPIMLMTIGIRYFIFQSIYGMRLYWVLGLCLIISGFFCLTSKQPFHYGGIMGGIIELVFGVFVTLKEMKYKS
tara:strand:- start:5466 stop:6146 length:681 start_codon:yes stop_codon:yes gene_type:complete